MADFTRRQFAALAIGGIGASFFLTGCGPQAASSQTSSADDAYKEATLVLGWWGNAVRNENTDNLIELYTKQHDTITIKPRPGEWSTYWTKLSTQVAGGTMPDIVQMDQKYIAEYGGRGALLDLSKQGALDLGDFPDSALESGTYDGKLFGINAGQNAYSVFANADVFADLGVDMPDDETWTWDDFFDVASAVRDASGGDVIGTSLVAQDADLMVWARQKGEELYTSDGQIGVSPESITSWFEYLLKLSSSGAGPNPDAFTQDVSAAVEQSLFATKKAAMGWSWTNQLKAYTEATGSDVKLLKLPSFDGSAGAAGMFFKPSMFWSASSKTENPAQTSAFIDFLVNDVDAAKIGLAERGMPVNPKVLDAIREDLSDADKAGLEFLEAIEGDVKSTPPIPPTGTSTVQATIQRYAGIVLFEEQSPKDAAQALHDEMTGLIS